jgi:hypothetical protein
MSLIPDIQMPDLTEIVANEHNEEYRSQLKELAVAEMESVSQELIAAGVPRDTVELFWKALDSFGDSHPDDAFTASDDEGEV